VSQAHKINTVAVFAASRDGLSPAFQIVASEVGTYLATHKISAGFGGVFSGLMNTFARAVLDNGGDLTGYLPQGLVPYANAITHPSYNEVIVASTTETRDRLAETDAAIVLPCGLGGNAEIADWIERQYLLFYDNPDGLVKPLIPFNVNGYFDGWMQQLNEGVQQGLVTPAHVKIVRPVTSIDEMAAVLNEPLRAAKEYEQLAL